MGDLSRKVDDILSAQAAAEREAAVELAAAEAKAREGRDGAVHEFVAECQRRKIRPDSSSRTRRGWLLTKYSRGGGWSNESVGLFVGTDSVLYLVTKERLLGGPAGLRDANSEASSTLTTKYFEELAARYIASRVKPTY